MIVKNTLYLVEKEAISGSIHILVIIEIRKEYEHPNPYKHIYTCTHQMRKR